MTSRHIMDGTVTTTRRAGVTVHTYTAPEEGLLVTTQIVEFDTQLFVVDAQLLLPHAREAAGFAESLGKPVTRLYISHDHPDHWLGSEAFGAPVHALPSTIAAVEAEGQETLARMRDAMPGDLLPEAPTIEVTAGEEVVDGVRVQFDVVTDSEAEEILTIAFPDVGIFIAQDLVYNDAHPYLAGAHVDKATTLANEALEKWQRALAHLQEKPFDVILPGHGLPTNRLGIDFVSAYLDVAKDALHAAGTGEELVAALRAAYPRTGGVGLLHIQNRFLFPSERTDPRRSAPIGPKVQNLPRKGRPL